MRHTPGTESLELGAVCTVTVRPIWLLAVADVLAVMDGGADPFGVTDDQLLRVPDWSAARALLVHGLALRDLLAERVITADGELPDDQEAGERWLRVQPPDFWRRLLAYGAASGLAYYASQMDPDPRVEALRQGWPIPLPSTETLMADEKWWRDAVMAQALSWSVDRAAITPLMDPGRLRIAVLDALRAADTAVSGALRSGSHPVPAVGPAARVIEEWTGRPLPASSHEELSSITTLTLVPTSGIGTRLSVVRRETHWVVWAEPGRQGTAADPAPAPDVRKSLRAMGDPVNQDLIRRLASSQAETGAALAIHLGVHPSTISRHLRALEAAGIIEPAGAGGHLLYRVRRDVLEAVADWFRDLAIRAGGGDDASP